MPAMGDATTRFFDAMAASYDELEPWYEHLYARLHRIVRDALGRAAPGARALDAGCGTGFQTAILAELGYRPHGLDLSGASLAVARGRVPGAALSTRLSVMIYKDTYEDLTPERLEEIIDQFAIGKGPAVPVGPQNGRTVSAPQSGLTSLKVEDGALKVTRDTEERADARGEEGRSCQHRRGNGSAVECRQASDSRG